MRSEPEALRERDGAARKPPRSYRSVPVWPSGDWLPLRCIERAMQVCGWFGLAGDLFPSGRVFKHQPCAVEELAFEPELLPAGAAPVAAVAADRMADGGEVRADLMGAPRLEPHAEQGRARKALHHLEMGDGRPRSVRTSGHRRPVQAVAAERRVDRAAVGVR